MDVENKCCFERKGNRVRFERKVLGFFFQAKDGKRDHAWSRGLGSGYKGELYDGGGVV